MCLGQPQGSPVQPQEADRGFGSLQDALTTKGTRRLQLTVKPKTGVYSLNDGDKCGVGTEGIWRGQLVYR